MIRLGKPPKPDNVGVDPNAPAAKNFKLYFSVLGREWWSLVKVNLFFLLLCLPIITIPAAMTALGRVTLLMVQDKAFFLWDEFWRCFKREFLPSLPIGFFVLGLSALGIFGVAGYYAMVKDSLAAMVPLVLILLVLALVLMMSPYLFAQQALVELPLRSIFLNALRLTARKLPRNLLCLILKLLLPAAILLFPPLVLLVFLGLFSLESLISAVAVSPALVGFCRPAEPTQALETDPAAR